MLNSINRVLVRNTLSCSVRFSPFSSQPPKPLSEIIAKNLSIADYLVNKFDFSDETACDASKYLRIDSSEKPESVIAFLKNRGLKSDQIGSIVRNFPLIAQFDPQKSLVPKIEFFESSGTSRNEVNNIILTAPGIFSRSLENHIIPCFNYIKNLFDSNGSSVSFAKVHFLKVLCCNLEAELIPNVEILREAGVPDSRIVTLLQDKPRTVMLETEKFREVVNKVKGMKFNPTGSMFIAAVCTIRSMSKLNWDNKVAEYKKWGFSGHDVTLAFHRYPYCMTLSTDKIASIMDFLVNEVGLNYSFVVKKPHVMCLSLEKRIKPRSAVYKMLLSNGLIRKGPFMNSFFIASDKDFMKNFVQRFEKEVPQLLECYQQSLDAAKSNMPSE